MNLNRIPKLDGFCSSSRRWLAFKMGFQKSACWFVPERVLLITAQFKCTWIQTQTHMYTPPQYQLVWAVSFFQSVIRFCFPFQYPDTIWYNAIASIRKWAWLGAAWFYIAQFPTRELHVHSSTHHAVLHHHKHHLLLLLLLLDWFLRIDLIVSSN